MIERAKTAIRRILPKKTFARGVSVLVGGTAAAQLLSLLAAPVLTRLYTPDDFGLLAVYGGLLALISVVSSLRYELAIPLPEDDQEAANVVVLCLLLVFGTSVLSALVLLFFGANLAQALGSPQLAGYFWLLPMGVLLGGTYTVFNYWSIRTKCFATVAVTRIRQALATIVIQLLAFKAGGVALLFAQVAGQSVGTASLAKPALERPLFTSVTWCGIFRIATRYRRFPLFSTPGALFNNAGSTLNPVLISALFSTAAAGVFSLSHRVISMPMGLVGSAIGQVFLSQSVDANRAGTLGSLVVEVQSRLIRIALPPTMILILFGPDLFGFIFGQEWYKAGEFSRWMAIWLFFQFIVSPLSMIFSVLSKEHQYVVWQGALFVLSISSLLSGSIFASVGVGVALLSMTSAVCYAALSIWLWLVSGASIINVLKGFVVSLLTCILCFIPALIVLFLGGNLVFSIIGITASLFLVALYFLKVLRSIASI